MSYLFRVSVFLVLISAGVAPSAVAQRPLEKLKKNWEESRPRGELFRKIFAGDEAGDDADAEDKPLVDEPRRRKPPAIFQPTPADPRLQAELQRSREIIAHQQLLLRLQQEKFQGYLGQDRSANPVPLPPLRSDVADQLGPDLKPERTYNDYFAGANPVAQSGHPQTLGLQVTPAGSEDNPTGLEIQKIQPKGAAAVAGLRRGDVIVSVGGIKTQHKEELDGIVDVLGPGDQIEFQILRDGKSQTLIIQLGDLPVEDLSSDPEPRRLQKIANPHLGDTFSPVPTVRTASRDEGVLKSVLVRD